MIGENMKLEPEVKAAISLKREYDTLKKYATRPGVSQLESDYYNRMAASTNAHIDWSLLTKKKEKKRDEYDYEGEFSAQKESRNRYHK
jgi:hypothetical protein